MAEPNKMGRNGLAHLKSNGLHGWDKPGLSGYLVSLMQLNKPDRPNRPNEQDRLADFFSILQNTKGGWVNAATSPLLDCLTRRNVILTYRPSATLTALPISAGFFTTRTPAASRAFIFSAAAP